jgi:hypothetical protein
MVLSPNEHALRVPSARDRGVVCPHPPIASLDAASRIADRDRERERDGRGRVATRAAKVRLALSGRQHLHSLG